MAPVNPKNTSFYCCTDAEQALWERRLDCVVASAQQLISAMAPPTPSASQVTPISPVTPPEQPSAGVVVVEYVMSVLHNSSLQSFTNVRTMKPAFVNDMLAALLPADWQGQSCKWNTAAADVPVTLDWMKRFWTYLNSLESLQAIADGEWPVLPTLARLTGGDVSRELCPLFDMSTVAARKTMPPEAVECLVAVSGSVAVTLLLLECASLAP